MPFHRVERPHRGGHQQNHRSGRYARGHECALHDVGAGEPVLFLHSYGPGTTAWITFHKHGRHAFAATSAAS